MFATNIIRPLNNENDFIDMKFLKNLSSKSITEDFGVIKYLLKEGKELEVLQKPPQIGAIAKVRLEGRRFNGELIHKNIDQNQKTRVNLWNDKYIKGIHVAISSMKIGEIAWFEIKPAYHYFGGSISSLSNQDISVDQNESLFYKIEMFDYRNNEVLDSNNYFGRISKYEESRKRGNEEFRKNDFEKAFRIYEEGLNLVRNFPKKLKESMSEIQRQEVINYCNILFGNCSLCKFKLKKYYECLKLVDEGLKISPTNIKLLYRKGQCYFCLNDFENAKIIFKEILSLNPSNNDSLSMIEKCNQKEKEESFKEKIKFKKVFEMMDEEEKAEKKQKKIKEKLKEKENNSKDKNEIFENEKNIDMNKRKAKITIEELEKGFVLDTNSLSFDEEEEEK